MQFEWSGKKILFFSALGYKVVSYEASLVGYQPLELLQEDNRPLIKVLQTETIRFSDL